MELEAGMRVVRGAGEYGFVLSREKRRIEMVEVRWEASGIRQTIPAEQVTPCPAVAPPPPRSLTPRGRSTPEYLVKLRKQIKADGGQKREKRDQAKAQRAIVVFEQTLEVLATGKNRQRSRASAQRAIGNLSRYQNRSSAAQQAKRGGNEVKRSG